MRIRGKDSPYLVTTGADDAPNFSLVWIYSPTEINRYNNTFNIVIEVEVARIIENFKVMEYRTVIILDQRDNGSLNKYINKF